MIEAPRFVNRAAVALGVVTALASVSAPAADAYSVVGGCQENPAGAIALLEAQLPSDVARGIPNAALFQSLDGACASSEQGVINTRPSNEFNSYTLSDVPLANGRHIIWQPGRVGITSNPGDPNRLCVVADATPSGNVYSVFGDQCVDVTGFQPVQPVGSSPSTFIPGATIPSGGQPLPASVAEQCPAGTVFVAVVGNQNECQQVIGVVPFQPVDQGRGRAVAIANNTNNISINGGASGSMSGGNITVGH